MLRQLVAMGLCLVVVGCRTPDVIELEDASHAISGYLLGEDAVADLITDCMAVQGFEYQRSEPITYSPTDYIADDETRIAEIGSGITHSRIIWAERMDREAAEPEPEVVPVEETPEYHNALYVWATVHGERYDGGCAGWAYAEMPIRFPFLLLQESLRAEYDDMAVEMFEDTRMLDLDERWAGCMLAEGFGSFFRPGEAMRSIGERAHLAFGIADPAERDAALAEALAYDVAVSSASWRCSQQLDYDTARTEIHDEHLRDFVDRSEEQIRRILDEADRAR